MSDLRKSLDNLWEALGIEGKTVPIDEAAEKVEKWAKTKPKEIQDAIERIVSSAYGEEAVEEVEAILKGEQ